MKKYIKKFRSLSLTRILTFIVLTITIPLTIFLIFVNLSLHLKRDKKLLDGKILEYRQYLLESLKDPLWSFSYDLIDNICTTLVKDEDIEYILVREVFVEDEEAAYGQEMFYGITADRYYKKDNFTLNMNDLAIGEIEIAYSQKKILSYRRIYILFASFFSILLVSILLIVTLLLIRRLISRFTKSLKINIHKISSGNYNDIETHDFDKELLPIMLEIQDMSTQINLREESLRNLNLVLQNEIIKKETAEKVLSDYKMHLENIVEQRTDELKKAKDLAEHNSKAKTEFLANMSHELRTPLNAILGYSQLLILENSFTKEQKEKITIINSSGEHLLALINDVLEISRIEFGQAKVKISKIDLPALLNKIIDMFEIKAREKNLYLRLEGENIPKCIYSDEGKIRQILINLIGNAIKFTENGGILLKVFYENDNLKILVKDTGVGIEKESFKKIFKMFEQTEEGFLNAEGFGLGLAISKEFAKLLGGDISVKSKKHIGSEFEVLIKAEKCDLDNISLDKACKIFPPSFLKLKTMIVDDDLENRKLLKELFIKIGFSDIAVFDSGISSLEAYKKEDFDLIFLDRKMPELDGFETMAEMKRISDRAIIAIVNASVYAEEIEEVYKAGADYFLSKPLDIHELEEILCAILFKMDFSNGAKNNIKQGEASTDKLLSLDESIEEIINLSKLGKKKDLELVITNLKEKKLKSKLLELLDNYDYQEIMNLVQKYNEK